MGECQSVGQWWYRWEKKLREAVATVEVVVVAPVPRVTLGKVKPLQSFLNARRMVQAIFTRSGNYVKTHCQ
jgi:hypothetical protein